MLVAISPACQQHPRKHTYGGWLLTEFALGDEVDSQGVSAGRSAVGSSVISTVNSAVGRARLIVLADGAVPRVAVVAVAVPVLVVDPPPVGIDGDLSVHIGAASASAALLPC